MILTWRALLILMLAALLILGAAWLYTAGWLAIGYLLICCGLIWLDRRLAGKVSRFQVERLHDNRLSLGAENQIRIQLLNRSPRAVKIWVRDEPPEAFRIDPNRRILSGIASARQTWDEGYTVLPLSRGDYRFGDLNLRWQGPLGLVILQSRIPAAVSVKVYPNLLDIRRYDLLLHKDRLREMGLRTVRQLGEGTEYDRLREYLPDDDFRRIDWKATARRNRPITVEFATERSQNILVVLDSGRMMQSPIGNIAKLDYTINAALLLSYVATGKGDRVGLLAFADDVHTYLTPKHGQGQFYRMLELLYNLRANPVEPDYRLALNYLALKQRKRAMVVIFTDISGGPGIDDLVNQVLLLNRSHLVLVVTISDPDINNAALAIPGDSGGVYQRAVAAQLLNERRLVLDSLRRRGVFTMDIPANQLSLAVISQYLQLKARMTL
ncbi:MAG: DUF58 domain-containing protein [Anaerolineaceae bacterium]